MKLDAFDALLQKTLQDKQATRAERKEISAALAEMKPDANQEALLLNHVFVTAKNATNLSASEVVAWLEEVVKAFRGQELAPSSTSSIAAEAYFSPGEVCVQRITSMIKSAQHSIDVCVFTITDDRIANVLLDAHKRKVQVRIVTDNEKAYDEGSDALALGKAGVPVRVDVSPFHMHHKFAIFDHTQLLTGSYNWTRGAASNNQENFIVTREAKLLDSYQKEFDRLWLAFAHSEIK
jgi:cardiolipin hydrolase